MSKDGYTITFTVEYADRPGVWAKLSSAIEKAGGEIKKTGSPRTSKGNMRQEIAVQAADPARGMEILTRLKSIRGVKLSGVSDLIFLKHLGGKIELRSKVPVNDRNDLSIVYTPGVALVSMAIHDHPDSVWTFTSKRNTVAVVSDGTAVLGLGDVGPEAAMPVMEGKAMLFKRFGGVDAWPICLSTKDPDEIVRTVKHIAPTFGGINLEDISAPRCFEIEDRLKQELDIPVFHDDQHGTAVVVLAGLTNALKIVRKRMEELKVVICGAGAAGVACFKMLKSAGAQDIICCDRAGIIHKGRREDMNPAKVWLAENCNPRGIQGRLLDAMEGADVFLGVSGPNMLTAQHLKRMNRDPVVFAMANPDPEITPEAAAPYARIMATGRSDYPNQINNALCFPGLFRGVLDVQARQINEEMKLAAANAIASVVKAEELSEQHIIPSIFDKAVARAVARAVADAARKTGVARKK